MHGGIADLPIVPTKSLVSSNSGNFRAKTNLREALECFEEKHQALCFFDFKGFLFAKFLGNQKWPLTREVFDCCNLLVAVWEANLDVVVAKPSGVVVLSLCLAWVASLGYIGAATRGHELVAPCIGQHEGTGIGSKTNQSVNCLFPFCALTSSTMHTNILLCGTAFPFDESRSLTGPAAITVSGHLFLQTSV